MGLIYHAAFENTQKYTLFYGFLSVKYATSGISTVSGREQNDTPCEKFCKREREFIKSMQNVCIFTYFEDKVLPTGLITKR